ncbi:galectin-6-like [Puntigrus tetrazona]|uniref:galectin-6-like n=1 Tax=Puntigrus tetrazona TaxID=1606681 RepID=UPI001C8A00A2|nr:galectin-6-like [Puntigrus tetrazona]
MADYQMTIHKQTIQVTSIEGGLQEGKSIIIVGRIVPDANRSHVILQCGSDSKADIALCINPRYEKGSARVMYNTYKNGAWGSERSTPESPIVKDKPFVIEILVTKEAYKISINGKHLMDYEHRIPVIQVNTISVDQNIKLEFTGYQNSLVVPYKTLINGGLQPGKKMVIYGVPNADSKRVEFNLRHRYGIAFHYLSLFDENVVVCNTYENGRWGTEKRSAAVPFIKGHLFQVKIICNREHYEVFVNGVKVHTYKHRFTKLDDVDVFEVHGQLQLIFVNI